MKKLGLIAVSAMMVSSAFAMDTQMVVKGRFDYQNTTTQTNGGAKAYSGNYKPIYLRWLNSAKFNETTKAELDLNLAASHAAAGSRTLSDMVDVAAVTKSFGHGLSAIIGKQTVLVGGRENDYCGKDVYTTSLFNQKVSTNQIGLTGQYEIAEQSFYIQHLESAEKATSRTDKKITGVAYYGNFMGGMITPILSYHKVGTDEAKKSNDVIAVGSKFAHGPYMFEIDYLSLKQNVATGTASKLSSVVAHLKYNHENYRPFAKYIMETGKDGFDMDNNVGGAGVTKSERNAWEVGLEYFPVKDEDMRYHVVYNSSEKKEKTGGTDKYKEDKIIVGVAFAYNILK